MSSSAPYIGKWDKAKCGKCGRVFSVEVSLAYSMEDTDEFIFLGIPMTRTLDRKHDGAIAWYRVLCDDCAKENRS